MPISVATPTITTVVTPQSRSAMSRGVPSNADIVILSKTASVARGASSGASWNPGLSRRNQGRTSAADVTRCQAFAIRSWETPANSLGKDRCRRKNTRRPAARGLEHLKHPGGDPRPVAQLAQDADLHVVDDQGGTLRAARLLQVVRDVQSVGPLHAQLPPQLE